LFCLSLINLVIFFPSATWWHAGEHGVCEFVVCELLGAWVEEELRVEALCDYAEAEYLTEYAGNLEW
jgi:hypothetical protein